MKKILAMSLFLFVLFVVAACNGGGEQSEEVLDYDTVIQNLAGTWDWPGGAGNPIFIYDDGTWSHSTGDTGLYGSISIAEYDGNFSLVFIVTRAEGPGAYGSPGIPYGYGVRYGDIWWDSVVYSPDTDELRMANWDGSMLLMERYR
ncbi:MAG: hypothetical protein FWC93_05455 [Defluviitaleaceae bacterium]|nr:hypothetical protein [Defluviitaleaceae bacterium]